MDGVPYPANAKERRQIVALQKQVPHLLRHVLIRASPAVQDEERVLRRPEDEKQVCAHHVLVPLEGL
jgi:hypothetical protein